MATLWPGLRLRRHLSAMKNPTFAQKQPDFALQPDKFND
jgi:hypothetical protein